MTLIIAFGSGRRGDCDGTSDRDILFIADTFAEANQCYAQFQDAGYSVSFFSSTRAAYLVSRGSLFFRHVFDEGNVISGDKREFTRLGTEWQAAKDYQFEIESTIDLLDLLEVLPACQRGVTIATDLAVTGLRSILIRRLAQDGLYVFAWQTVLSEASRRGLIPAYAKRLVLDGRVIKNEYRRFGQARASLSVVQELLSVTRTATSCSCTMPRVRLAAGVTKSRVAERLSDYSYKQLRAWEFVCAEYPRDPALTEFERWSKQPNYFCSPALTQGRGSANFSY